jgi:hypothetical protein
VEGLAAAHELTTRAVSTTPRDPRAGTRSDRTYIVTAAGPEDDCEIRRLLRESAFAGDVSLSLEREPDSRIAAAIEGDVHDTLVARHRVSGEVAAIASRSVRDAFLNGVASRLGYLGQLRIDPRFRRHRGLLDAGFAFCRSLHLSSVAGDARIYLASVVAENEPARRLLAQRVPGWPCFEPVDTLVSLAVPVRRRSDRGTTGLHLVRGSADLATEIAACLDRNGRRAQFSPCWSGADLVSPVRTRGLELDDFVVAIRGGEVIGCVACWDQRAFKQVVVRGYSPRVTRWRSTINLLAPFTGVPALPAVGAQFQFAYISHVAIDGDEVDVLVTLVKEACHHARMKGVEHVVLGLSAKSAALPRVKRSFRHRAYESLLYVAYWPDGESVANTLDGRPSSPEVAIL